MSRVGKQIITIPAGVTVTQTGDLVVVKGPKGTLEQRVPAAVHVVIAENTLTVNVNNPEEKSERSLWGTFGSLLTNMVKGVTVGFERKLEVQGVGYRVALQGKDLRLDVGFSHPVIFPIPEGITIVIEKNIITVSGNDKQCVGEVAAQIRKVKKPEPYKGKGIRYVGEEVRRKEGKAAAKAA